MNPENRTVSIGTSHGEIRVTLTWGASLGRNINAAIVLAQRELDSEVLRGCAALVPFREGYLQKSGPEATVIGSGEVRWDIPYARYQYYKGRMGSNGEARRGPQWFERWKNQSGQATVDAIKRRVGARL